MQLHEEETLRSLLGNQFGDSKPETPIRSVEDARRSILEHYFGIAKAVAPVRSAGDIYTNMRAQRFVEALKEGIRNKVPTP